MRKVESFSVDTENDKDIINHLKKLKNKSQYIKDLIRKDINTSRALTEDQIREIKELIMEVIKDKEFNIVHEEMSVDDDVYNALLDLEGEYK